LAFELSEKIAKAIVTDVKKNLFIETKSQHNSLTELYPFLVCLKPGVLLAIISLSRLEISYQKKPWDLLLHLQNSTSSDKPQFLQIA